MPKVREWAWLFDKWAWWCRQPDRCARLPNAWDRQTCQRDKGLRSSATELYRDGGLAEKVETAVARLHETHPQAASALRVHYEAIPLSLGPKSTQAAKAALLQVSERKFRYLLNEAENSVLNFLDLLG